MGQWIFLLIFTGLFATIKAVCNDSQVLLCSAANCGIVGNTAKLGDGRNISCDVVFTKDKDIPRVNASTDPAVPPDDTAVGCYLLFSEKLRENKAVLNVTWGNKEIYIRREFLKGYYLEFGMQTFRVNLKFNGKSIEKEREVPSCITFMYNCYGWNAYLRPGRLIGVMVRPVPRSKRNSMPSNVKYIPFTVPEVSKCWNPTPQPHLLTSGSPTTDHTLPKYQSLLSTATSNSGWEIALWVTNGLFFVIVIIFVIVKRRKVLKLAKDDNKGVEARTHLINQFADVEARTCLVNPSRSILVLANRSSTEDCQKGHSIAIKLRESHQVNVSCNFENTNEIVYHQKPISWWDRTVSAVDTIIFVNGIRALRQSRKSPSDEESRNNDMMNEFESLIEHYYGMKWEKKVIFLEDKQEELKYFERQGRKDCKVLLYHNTNLLYKELFGNADELFKTSSV